MGKTFKIGRLVKSWDRDIDFIPHSLASEPLEAPLYSINDLYQAFEIFEGLSYSLDPPLRKFVLAWDDSKMLVING